MVARSRLGLATLVVASVLAFGVGFYLRMNAAYGPFNLTARPADWVVLWDLLVHGQMSTRVLLESTAAGLLAATLLWFLSAAIRSAWTSRR